MFCVVVIRRLDDKLPASPTATPKRGEILGNAADILEMEDRYFPFDEAWTNAQDFNKAELVNPQGIWAIVVRDDVEVSPGDIADLKSFGELN